MLKVEMWVKKMNVKDLKKKTTNRTLNTCGYQGSITSPFL